MRYPELVEQLLARTPFATHKEAELALQVSLQTLRALLPRAVASQLASTLPRECRPSLYPPSEEDDGLVMIEPAREDGAPQGSLLERVQMTCAALSTQLPPDVLERLARELPERLAQAFEPHGSHDDSAAAYSRRSRQDSTLAGGRPGGSHPLSEAAPGSTKPLSSARADRVQSGSVADPNPHGETKLSSSKGTTQEREAETLAEGQPK